VPQHLHKCSLHGSSHGLPWRLPARCKAKQDVCAQVGTKNMGACHEVMPCLWQCAAGIAHHPYPKEEETRGCARGGPLPEPGSSAEHCTALSQRRPPPPSSLPESLAAPSSSWAPPCLLGWGAAFGGAKWANAGGAVMPWPSRLCRYLRALGARSGHVVDSHWRSPLPNML